MGGDAGERARTCVARGRRAFAFALAAHTRLTPTCAGAAAAGRTGPDTGTGSRHLAAQTCHVRRCGQHLDDVAARGHGHPARRSPVGPGGSRAFAEPPAPGRDGDGTDRLLVRDLAKLTVS